MILFRNGLSLILLITIFIFKVSAKSSCDICKDIVDSFKSGLEKTIKSNFGGGNTNWEEKSLGKWKTSETRLVEIVDHHICEGNDKQCHAFFENNEESLEDWYFNIYKDLDSADGLHDHLCISASKACCPSGTYGKDCQECPSHQGQICGGHGSCQGDGTRSGDGSCKCDTGYDGKLCDECGDNFYEQLTGSISQCLACHESCLDTCTGGEPISCDECADGYTWDDSFGCQDEDECEKEDVCEGEEGTFCVNSLGSYRCESCHSTCLSCTGSEPDNCTSCVAGYERTTPDGATSTCQDMDECALRPDLCTSIKGAKCSNTEGSYDCRCEVEGQRIEGAECVDTPDAGAEEQSPSEEANVEEKSKEDINKADRDEL